MRTVSPAFSRTNPVGPFSPIIIGSSLEISSDSFVFTDGTDLSAKVPIQKSVQLQSELKVYLQIKFKKGAIDGIEVKSGSSWWAAYPKVLEFSDNARTLEKQIALYAPIFSVSSDQVGSAYARTSEKNFSIYRHIYNNLMIMQTCTYFFLLPAPAAPGMDSTSQGGGGEYVVERI